MQAMQQPQQQQQLLQPQRTGRWTLDEKILFLYGLRKFGKGRWKKISIYLPKRYARTTMLGVVSVVSFVALHCFFPPPSRTLRPCSNTRSSSASLSLSLSLSLSCVRANHHHHHHHHHPLQHNSSLVQIKSHAQKVLKRQEEGGENIFRRLDDNRERMDQLVSEVHERLGGEPPNLAASPVPRRNYNNSSTITKKQQQAQAQAQGGPQTPLSSSSSFAIHQPTPPTMVEASIQTDPYEPMTINVSVETPAGVVPVVAHIPSALPPDTAVTLVAPPTDPNPSSSSTDLEAAVSAAVAEAAAAAATADAAPPPGTVANNNVKGEQDELAANALFALNARSV